MDPGDVTESGLPFQPALENGTSNGNRGRALLHHLRSDSLLRNSAYIMATTVITGLMGYVYWILAAREYSTGSVGLASALVSVMMLTSSVCTLGINSTLIGTLPRRTAGDAWSRTMTAGSVLGMGTGVVGAGVVLLVLPLVSAHLRVIWDSPTYLILFLGGVPIWTVSTVLDAAFVAERRSVHMLLRNAWFSGLKIVLLTLPVFIHMNVTGILATWVLAASVSVIAAFAFQVPRLHRAFRPTVVGLVPEIRSLLRSLAGHHFINLGGMAPMYLLPAMVAVRVSISDSAYFYTTWMVCSLFFMASPAVAQSLFAEGIHGPDHLRRKVRTSAGIIAALLVPAAVFFVVAGNHILSLFGPAYARHGLELLFVLLGSTLPDAITNMYVSVMRVLGRLRRAAALNLGMAALALGLAWFLLPVYGILGAGLAWGGAQCAGTLVVAVELARNRVRTPAKYIAAATAVPLPESRIR